MKLDWFIYISPRKDTPMKESHQSFRIGDLKQNKMAKNFALTYTNVHILTLKNSLGTLQHTVTYRIYIYVHVHAIKEDSMVVAIFRHYWSPLDKEFYINIEENTQILNVNYMIFSA